ncbi:hypothetical protein IFM89_032801, partial [Coptis chinensis]
PTFSQENEAARTNDEWCISTVKKLKEASPLGLKVSLRSVTFRYERVYIRVLINALFVSIRCPLKGFPNRSLETSAREPPLNLNNANFYSTTSLWCYICSGILLVWTKLQERWSIIIFLHLVNLNQNWSCPQKLREAFF